METKNSTYIILSVILLILSVFGGYFLFQNFQATNQTSYNSKTVPKIELIPTDAPETEQITAIPTIESSSSAKITSIPATSSTSKISPTKIPTKTITPTKSATSSSTSLKDYSNSTDGFSVSYSSSRKIYQTAETLFYDSNYDFYQGSDAKGNRYTFSESTGKNDFAIHVTSNEFWCWKNAGRQFSQSFTVNGQPTFRHEQDGQIIIDLQSNGKNYTLQCVHNNKDSVKAECEAFIASFKLL